MAAPAKEQASAPARTRRLNMDVLPRSDMADRDQCSSLGSVPTRPVAGDGALFVPLRAEVALWNWLGWGSDRVAAKKMRATLQQPASWAYHVRLQRVRVRPASVAEVGSVGEEVPAQRRDGLGGQGLAGLAKARRRAPDAVAEEAFAAIDHQAGLVAEDC